MKEEEKLVSEEGRLKYFMRLLETTRILKKYRFFVL